jgi:hypothetical protein
MNPELSSKFMLKDHKIVTVFCKTLSQQKHVVLQSTAPLKLKRFPPQYCRTRKKNSFAKSPDSLTHPVYVAEFLLE